MFTDHQPIIEQWARARSANLARVLQFCIASAREKFFNVPAVMDDPDNNLWGWKRRAWSEAETRAEELHLICEELAERASWDHALAYVGAYYGLNVAKAGFFLQLAYGASGCIDTINQERHGISHNKWRNLSQRRTPQGRLSLARSYNATIAQLGGTAHLWDSWCAEITRRYPEHFPSADDASAWHLTCLGLS